MLELNTPYTLGYIFTHPLPSMHGNSGSGEGGAVALLDQILDRITRLFGDSNAPQPPADAIGWLPGLKTLADNPHPMIVHFPIAFLFAFFALECYTVITRKTHLRQVSSTLLYLGAVGALITAAAGLYAAMTVPHAQDVHEILEWHGRLGLTVASLATVLSVWRWFSPVYETVMSKTFKFILTTVMAVALFFGADLGGFMVYKHGVGVKAVKQIENHSHSQHGG